METLGQIATVVVVLMFGFLFLFGAYMAGNGEMPWHDKKRRRKRKDEEGE